MPKPTSLPGQGPPQVQNKGGYSGPLTTPGVTNYVSDNLATPDRGMGVDLGRGMGVDLGRGMGVPGSGRGLFDQLLNQMGNKPKSNLPDYGPKPVGGRPRRRTWRENPGVQEADPNALTGGPTSPEMFGQDAAGFAANDFTKLKTGKMPWAALSQIPGGMGSSMFGGMGGGMGGGLFGLLQMLFGQMGGQGGQGAMGTQFGDRMRGEDEEEEDDD